MAHKQRILGQITDDSTRNFTYDTIHSQHKQIRLLRIIKDTKGSTHSEEAEQVIRCTIETSSLLAAPYFYALSYRWDSSPAGTDIVINNSAFSVGKNLYLALQRLQDYLPVDEERSCELGFKISLPIWIDAISINQTDPDEKGWQVAQMGEIYTKASQTVVWLGPAFHGSDKAIARLSEVGRNAIDRGFSFEQHWPSWFEHLVERTEEFAEGRLPKEELNLENFFWTFTHGHVLDRTLSHARGEEFIKEAEKVRIEALEGILKLMRSEWWCRVWVIQEVTLAQELEFLCGEDVISWEHLNTSLLFFSAAESVQGRLLDLGLDRVAGIRGKAILDQPQYRDERGSRSSKLVLRITRFDVRHKLAADGIHLMKMKPHTEYAPTNLDIRRQYLLRRALKSDDHLGTWLYNVTVRQPPQKASDPRDLIYALGGLLPLTSRLYPDYQKTVVCVFTDAAKLCLEQGYISILSLCQWPKRYDTLPTWVPDWSQPLRSPIEDIRKSSIQSKPITFHNNGLTICIQGHRLLTISHVLNVDIQSDPNDISTAFLLNLDNDYLEALRNLGIPLSKQQRHSNLIKLLLSSAHWPHSHPGTQPPTHTLPNPLHHLSHTLPPTAETNDLQSLIWYLSKILNKERISDYQTWTEDLRSMSQTYSTVRKLSPAFGKLIFRTVRTYAEMLTGRVDLIRKNFLPLRRLVTRVALVAACEKTLEGRAVFVGEDGSVGVCPRNARDGDVLVGVERLGSPCVVRRGEGGRYCLVGEGFWEGAVGKGDLEDGDVERFFIE